MRKPFLDVPNRGGYSPAVRLHRTRLTLQAAALAAAAIVAVAPALQTAHFALEHAICAEHGELIHVSSHDSEAGATAAAGDSEHDTLQRARGGSSADDAHCDLLRSLNSAVTAPLAKTKSVRAVVAPTPELRTLRLTALPILSVAPKLSPPRAA